MLNTELELRARIYSQLTIVFKRTDIFFSGEVHFVTVKICLPYSKKRSALKGKYLHECTDWSETLLPVVAVKSLFPPIFKYKVMVFLRGLDILDFYFASLHLVLSAVSRL